MQRVCVIGLGTIGYPTALAISQAGFEVEGFDVDRSKRSLKGHLRVWSSWDEVPPCDIYVVCVPTGLKGNTPDMSVVFETSRSISQACRGRRVLVCIESTVSLGTSRIVCESLNGQLLVYVPHRYWTGDPANHGVRQKRVIGALDGASMRAGHRFYGKVGVPLTELNNLEEAEMTKIVENSYRFVQIAFAEELSLICESRGLDWQSIRRAANTKWNIEIPEARRGIFGCLSKDVRYLLKESQERQDTINGAVRMDNVYKHEKRNGPQT